MQLGFVTAILPELSLQQVADFAAQTGYMCVEAMCWPSGGADARRYAGITHIDVDDVIKNGPDKVRDIMTSAGVAISGLGYYPNPLCADKAEAAVYVAHIKKVIQAAGMLGVGMNTFVGRDQTKTVDDNWPRFLETWRPIVAFAEAQGVRVGIENCPMSFTRDEWPGGKNLATSPAIWRRMFSDIPSANFGLNFDPSHFVWQQMDYVKVLREFKDKLFHFHAKDARLDRARLNEVGLLAHPLEYHTPKLPGLGHVKWNVLLSTLSEVYDGPVAVEVEDRAYEGSLEKRQEALRQSLSYLRQFIVG